MELQNFDGILTTLVLRAKRENLSVQDITNRDRATAQLQSIIRTEKLKLLAEVRERVVEQAKPDKRKATSWQQGIEVAAYEDAVRVYEYKMSEQLTKLEAEL